MTESDRDESTVAGKVADAPEENWVDRWCPPPVRPYLRLSRADRPIGTWLLLLPCWWGIALAVASQGNGWSKMDIWLLVACGLGAFLMRGAGCTWNDITDRHIDAQVARTRSRPLPSGQVTTRNAAIWMIVQALVAFAILLTFNSAAILLGILSLAPVAIYPFAKRFTWWPQVFLGIAFNWGALLGWVAVTGSLSAAPIVLYLGGIAWTLFYDTIYAHQDTDDDALIGVKSTARLFGDNSPRWLLIFQIVTVTLLALAAILALGHASAFLSLIVALIGVWALGVHLHVQLSRLDTNDPQACLVIFRSNRNAGLLVFAAFAVASMLAA